MMESEDFALLLGPEENLLETDIAGKSYNKAPWGKEKAPRKEMAKKTDRLVLRSGGGGDDDDDDDDDPLSGLDIADGAALLLAGGDRGACADCGSSRRFFCYRCLVPLASTADAIPRVEELPLKVDVVKHEKELDGKSTAVHAKIISPDDVLLFTYPDFPDYSNEKVVLVYPDEKGEEDGGRGGTAALDDKVQRAVFVDATWSQAKQIVRNPKLCSLPRASLRKRKTAFWRHQKGKSDEHLATIEAIYYFVRDFHTDVLSRPYAGEYDNLLFLFKFFRDQLRETYLQS